MLTLVTGGARSGKSRFAQSLCAEFQRVSYIATALPSDGEMAARIAAHRHSRPSAWVTTEEPLAISAAIRRQAACADAILVDCITVWLSNLFFQFRDLSLDDRGGRASLQVADLIEASASCNVIAVTNEVGSSIVPETALGREFRDAQGFVNQQLARAADSVFLLVCGLPITIKNRLQQPIVVL